jgi:hypothetical protein
MPTAVPLELVEDAANILAWQGYWEPHDEDVIPDEMAAELTAIAAGCELCRARADLNNQQVKYEMSLPVWVCDCDARFKIVDGYQTEVYRVGEDGTLGDLVGTFRAPKPRAKDPGLVCPGCMAGFAATMARRAAPQQSLF